MTLPLFPSFASDPEVIIFTDGGCSGNPGPGGWAFILRHIASDKEHEGFGAEIETTNNRMELIAVIEGLSTLTRPTSVQVVTDSSYVEKGLSEWMPRWKANRWRRKTSHGWAEVKNMDLWEKLDRLAQTHQVILHRVKGHAGHLENERCDELAVQAYKDLMRDI
jgi:ribonuclease HI